MRSKRVMQCQLLSNQPCQISRQASLHINARELIELPGWIGGQFLSFPHQICLLRIGLALNRHKLSCRHRCGTRNRRRQTGEQDGWPRSA